MTDLESTAARGSDAAAVPGPVPTVADRRVTDLSASVGSVVWLALVAGALGGAVPLSPVALYVAFATLVLVPLGIGLLGSAHGPAGVAGGTRAPPAATPYRIAVVGQFPAALAVAAALAAPQGTLGATALVVPWLAVTGAIALVGLRRLAVRGIGPLPELAVDAACLYVPVAAVFLLFHAAGIGLRFAPIIVLLTGVHFHYAGFVLPLVVGLVGRRVATDDGGFAPTVAGRGAAAVTLVVVAGIGLIAVGIAFSPLPEAAPSSGSRPPSSDSRYSSSARSCRRFRGSRGRCWRSPRCRCAGRWRWRSRSRTPRCPGPSRSFRSPR